MIVTGLGVGTMLWGGSRERGKFLTRASLDLDEWLIVCIRRGCYPRMPNML